MSGSKVSRPAFLPWIAVVLAASAAGMGAWAPHIALDERGRFALVAALVTVAIAAHGAALAWWRCSRFSAVCLLIGIAALGAGRVAHFDLEWHAHLDSLGTQPGSDKRLVSVEGIVISTPRDDEFAHRDELIACGALEEDTLARFVPRTPTLRFTLLLEAWIDGAGTRHAAAATLRVVVDGSTAGCVAGERILAKGWLRSFDRPTNPGGFDSAHWSRSRSIAGLLLVPDSQLIERVDGTPLATASLLARWRSAVDASLRRALGDDPRLDATALLAASTTGANWPGLRSVSKAFAACGLQHLVAISGFNFGILAACALWLVSQMRLTPRIGGWVLIALAVLFVASIEAEVSSARAALMGGSAALALAVGRALPFGSVMSIAAIVIVVADPLAPSEPGFQLSFGAIFGLRYLTAPLARWMSRWVRGFGVTAMLVRRAIEPVAASIGAWIAAAPIVLLHFGVVQLLCIPGTIVLSPIFAAMVISSNAAIALEVVCPPAGSAAGALAIWNARAVLAIARIFATLPGSAPYVAVRQVDDDRDWRLRLDMIDVGNGSCYLIRSGASAVLLDCGSLGAAAIGSQTVVPALRALGVASLDAVLVSHPNLDHYGAVPEVVRAFSVPRVLVTPQFVAWARERGGSAREALRASERAGATVETIAAGDVLSFGSTSWRVLHPPHDRAFADSNDGSLIVRISDGALAIIMSGDAAREACRAVLRAPTSEHLRGSTIFELPHHGSFRAESAALATHAASQIVLQSTGSARLRKDKWDGVLGGAQRLITARDHACAVYWKNDGAVIIGQWDGHVYQWRDCGLRLEVPAPPASVAPPNSFALGEVAQSPLTISGDEDRPPQNHRVADWTTTGLLDLNLERTLLDHRHEMCAGRGGTQWVAGELAAILPHNQLTICPDAQCRWNLDLCIQHGKALGDFVDEPFRPPDLNCGCAEWRVIAHNLWCGILGAGERLASGRYHPWLQTREWHDALWKLRHTQNFVGEQRDCWSTKRDRQTAQHERSTWTAVERSSVDHGSFRQPHPHRSTSWRC